jgi:hypothetical protein
MRSCSLSDLMRAAEAHRARVSVLDVGVLWGVACVSLVLAGVGVDAGWAAAPRMSVSFLAVGSEVDAGGMIGARVVKGPSSTVVLQQRVGSRWVVRASGKLSRHGRSYGFSVKWLGAPAAGGVAVRVQLLRGRVVVARSATRVVRSSSVVSVQRTLRPSTVQPAASSVVGVSGSPYGQTVVVLGRGARVPVVGGALVLEASAKAPVGVLGVVTAVSRLPDGVRVTTRPGTLEDAYSSFDAHLDGELGQLTQPQISGSRARSDVKAWSCCR